MSNYYRPLIRTNREDDPYRIAGLKDGEVLHEGWQNCIRAAPSPKGTSIRFLSGDPLTGREPAHGCSLNSEQLDLFIDSLIGLRAEMAKRRELLNDGKLTVQKQDTGS